MSKEKSCLPIFFCIFCSSIGQTFLERFSACLNWSIGHNASPKHSSSSEKYEIQIFIRLSPNQKHNILTKSIILDLSNLQTQEKEDFLFCILSEKNILVARASNNVFASNSFSWFCLLSVYRNQYAMHKQGFQGKDSIVS